MNSKQKFARASKIKKKAQDLRNQLWPKLDYSLLWDRTKKKGFTTIPRTMPLILKIIDDLAEKGKPVSNVYLTLWCRVFDESFVEIKNSDELAYESGFTGQRAVTVWKSRMKNLVKLGFIDTKEGASGEYNYVLIYNPYIIIKRDLKKNIQQRLYNALFARAQEIGADDLQI